MNILSSKDIFVFDSKKDGINVCILCGVHGNEVGGIKAVKQVIEMLNDDEIKLILGKLIFVFANPLAIKNNVRFVEENLNRCFVRDEVLTSSYEEKLSFDLKEILNSCDVCLDLHSSFVRDSSPFIICESNAFNLVQNFPVNTICSGFDLVQPGGTDYYMNKLGRTGICVECGYLDDESSSKIALEVILIFLNNLKLISRFDCFEIKDYNKENKEFLEVKKIYFAKNNFRLVKGFKDFEKVKKNDLIGFDDNKRVYSDYDGFILFSRNVNNKEFDREAFLLGVRNKKSKI